MSNAYGDYLKSLRISKRLSLRDVCSKAEYDPSNWSKVERGILPPPADEATLNKWAGALGLQPKEEGYIDFMDKAALAKGMIPKDIAEEEEIMAHIPAFFRTLRGQKPSKEEIDKIIDLLRKS